MSLNFIFRLIISEANESQYRCRMQIVYNDGSERFTDAFLDIGILTAVTPPHSNRNRANVMAFTLIGFSNSTTGK